MNKKRSQANYKISQKKDVSKEKKSTGNLSRKTELTNDKFAVLFDASPVAMSLATIGEGKMIDVNQAWLDLVGITDKENVLGKTSVELGLIPDVESRERILNKFKQHGSVKNAEIIANNKNGDRIFLLVNLKEIEIGGIRYLFSTNENITKNKQSEERLRYHANLVETVSDAIISTDTENKIRSWNCSAEKLYGWSMEEVIGKKGADLLKTKFQEGFSRELLLKEMHEVGSWHGELIQRTKDGRAIQVEATSITLKDDGGKSIGGVSIVRDITGQKKAQEALTDAQRLTQSLINHTPAIVYALDLEERFLLANKTLADLLDSTPGAMIGKRRHEFMPKDDADWHEANDRRVIKEGRPIEFEEHSQLKDRSITWLTTKFPLLDSHGRIYAIAGISNDISERKQAQVKTETLLAEIQIEKERLATLIKNIPDEVWIADLNKNFILMNSISRQQFGLNKDIIGIEEFASSIEVLRPDYSSRPLEESPALLALKGDIVKNLEEIIRIPASGELRHRQVNSSPVKDASGKITGSIAIVRDITERKKAEEELVKLGLLLSESQKIAHLGSFEYIAETQTTIWSEEEFRIYGLDPAGQSPQYDEMIVKCIHPDDAELLNSTFSTAMSNGSVYELEHRIVRPDGSIRIVYDKAHPYFDSKGKLVRYIGATLDITERKQAEDELKEGSE